MKGFYLSLLLIVGLPMVSVAQITWNTNMTAAKGIALSEGKLILVDFWATWCGPCKKMDKELWNSPEIKPLSEKLVFLKVDIDMQRNLAMKYNVRSIPRVLIMSAAGDIIVDETGYRGASTYLNLINSIPSDVQQLNTKIIPIVQGKTNGKNYLELGEAYQHIGKKEADKSLKAIFLRLSNNYLKKVSPKKGDEGRKATLLQCLNMVYNGSPKKARKKLTKYADDYFTGGLEELRSFVLAYAYKHEGEKGKVETLRSELNNPEYLAELEN